MKLRSLIFARFFRSVALLWLIAGVSACSAGGSSSLPISIAEGQGATSIAKATPGKKHASEEIDCQDPDPEDCSGGDSAGGSGDSGSGDSGSGDSGGTGIGGPTGIDPSSTAPPNSALLPPGAYQNWLGYWFNSYGQQLTWCADCNGGGGTWIATIGNVYANPTGPPTFNVSYASQPSGINLLISILCSSARPNCKNSPVIFPTFHGSLHFAPGQNLQGLQEAIVSDIISKEFFQPSLVYPGMPATPIQITYAGGTFVYVCIWLGSPVSPGQIIISNYYMLL
jgi:hypothetical protein